MKEKKKIIGSIVLVSMFIFFIFIGYFISKPEKNYKKEDIFVDNTVKGEEKKSITIYVNGEVKKPGVYKLKENSRIEDGIKIAGGFTENADKDRLNLAKRLKDEDYVYVDELKNNNDDIKSEKNNSKEGSINNNGKININKASKEELKTIPGVGEVTAEKIIDYREKNRGFNSIDELKKIERIGEKTFEKFKDKVDIR